MSNFMLTQRDLRIFQEMRNRGGYMTTSHIAMYFPSLKIARRRLSKYINEKLMDRFRRACIIRTSGSTEYVYYLTRKVKKLEPIMGINMGHVKNTPPQRSIQHILKINDFENIIKLSGKKLGYDVEFIPPYVDAKPTNTGIISLISDTIGISFFTPDGALCISKTTNDQTKRLLFLLEIDCHTMTLKSRTTHGNDIYTKLLNYREYFLSKKYVAKYKQIFNWTFKGFRVLYITLSEKRLFNIINLAVESNITDFIWGTTFDKLNVDTILTGKIWLIAGNGVGSLVKDSY